MDSLVARAGLWLAALLIAVFMFANAVDSGFAVHMVIFALAALVGLVFSLRGSNYKMAAAGARPLVDQGRYDDDLIRTGVILTTFWGCVGFLAGLVIALQLSYPVLNLGIEYTSFGRLRPLHTSAVVFAFGGTALITTSFYVVQRTCRARL
ncbi:MAG: cbb3-type cytochrome c oxidase subunit I, partial [Novosphingobium sp.]